MNCLPSPSGLIIVHGRCVSGHMVHLSELLSGLSQIHHQNALTKKTWEDAVQDLGKWTALTDKICIKYNFLFYYKIKLSTKYTIASWPKNYPWQVICFNYYKSSISLSYISSGFNFIIWKEQIINKKVTQP